jgi:hypothetical protein
MSQASLSSHFPELPDLSLCTMAFHPSTIRTFSGHHATTLRSLRSKDPHFISIERGESDILGTMLRLPTWVHDELTRQLPHAWHDRSPENPRTPPLYHTSNKGFSPLPGRTIRLTPRRFTRQDSPRISATGPHWHRHGGLGHHHSFRRGAPSEDHLRDGAGLDLELQSAWLAEVGYS